MILVHGSGLNLRHVNLFSKKIKVLEVWKRVAEASVVVWQEEVEGSIALHRCVVGVQLHRGCALPSGLHF